MCVFFCCHENHHPIPSPLSLTSWSWPSVYQLGQRYPKKSELIWIIIPKHRGFVWNIIPFFRAQNSVDKKTSSKSNPSPQVVVYTYNLWWWFRHGHTPKTCQTLPSARSAPHGSDEAVVPDQPHRIGQTHLPRGFHGGPTMGCGVPRDRTIDFLYYWK